MRRFSIVHFFPFTSLLMFALTAVLIQPAQAQTFTVLHNFTGGQDGASPAAGLTMDRAGNLYGTTGGNGVYDNGTVFKLKHTGSGWLFTPLYSFAGGDDGNNPEARVVFGPNGTLYGTTVQGGGNGCGGDGCGTVFNLRPPARACTTALCPWTETVIHRFAGSDGAGPYGDLVFDTAGNLYGTTAGGGAYGLGAVFELTPTAGGWTESVLYSFTGGNDGYYPYSGVVFDQSGNLYGTAYSGGLYDYGTVFQLMPSGSAWTENTLYAFQDESDGAHPVGGLIFDKSGNLYGTAVFGGSGGVGTVFALAPSNGNWAFTVLYALSGPLNGHGSDASLTMDAASNLYGTTAADGEYQYGSVFKLTPSGGSWTYTDLHNFTGQSDGGFPIGGVVLDASGDLYGTTEAGGAYNHGVVWEITP